MKFKQLLLLNLVQSGFTLASDYSQPEIENYQTLRTRTITEFYTVTAPAENEVLVTETITQTVEPVQTAVPLEYQYLKNDGIEDAIDTDVNVDEEDIDKAKFGFDADYFSRRYGKLPDQPKVNNPDFYDFDPSITNPEDELLEDFHKLNHEEYSHLVEESPDQTHKKLQQDQTNMIGKVEYIFDYNPTDDFKSEDKVFEKNHNNIGYTDNDTLQRDDDGKLAKGKQIINDSTKDKIIEPTTTPSNNSQNQPRFNSASKYEGKLKGKKLFGLSEAEINGGNRPESLSSAFMVMFSSAFLALYFWC